MSVRKVLKYYTTDFLDKNMYMCLSIAIMFYALWTHDPDTIAKLGTDAQVWTVPLVIVIAMKYSLDIESDEYADPVDILTHDKWILSLGIIYMIVMTVIMYV